MDFNRFLSGSGFRLPTAMTVAGSDSGGGAGIQADLKTFTAFGVFGTTAITAITAQNTLGVERVQALEPPLVAAQIEVILGDIGAGAVKTGMLANRAIVEAVAEVLRSHRVKQLVVDPVMVSATGHRLLDVEAVAALKDHLFPLALVLTPNLPEAEALLGQPIRTLAEMQAAAEQLAATGCRYVVVKGGHLHSGEYGARAGGEKRGREGTPGAAASGAGFPAAGASAGGVSTVVVEPPPPLGYPWSAGDELLPPPARQVEGRFAVDVVYDGRNFTLLQSPFFDTRNTHGTGCTFSAAIAAALSLGYEPLEAIVEAKRFITRAIQHAGNIGKGHGPTNHLLRYAPARGRSALRSVTAETGVRRSDGVPRAEPDARAAGERGARANASERRDRHGA